MEKKSALAMLLIFTLWMIYLTVFAPKKPQTPPPGQDGQQSVETGSRPGEAPSAEKPGPSGQPFEQMLAGSGAESPALQVKPDTIENLPVDTVVVSSDLYEYRFITRGGILTQACLKQYPAFRKKDGKGYDDSQPVQLVPPRSEFLHSWLCFGPDQKVDLGVRNFTADRLKLQLDNHRPEGSVTFTHSLPGENQVRLVYTFNNSSYLIEGDLYLPPQLHSQSGNYLEVTLGPTLVSNEKILKDDYSYYEVVYYDRGEVVKKSIRDLAKSNWAPTGESEILWGGIKSKYFISTFFVPKNPMVGMSASGSSEPPEMTFRGRFPIPLAEKPVHFSLYTGPQSLKQIKELNYGLQKILEYGWAIIQPFCKIMLAVLIWMHNYIKNYAVIVILFALLVKVVFYPLTIRSTKSQIKMQKIQPLMNQLKEQYKDDPRKQQEEMMRLYREHKVNPLGSCLPMLIQMPVLFALFWVFRLTIEFRGAAGFWWINDLSQPDPIYILPVAMGATTYLQQKLTPTPMDPKMAPMMYIMPFFLTFMFLKFSSGLNLYYLFYNVFQIAQQIYTNKLYHQESSPLPRAAAKARVTAKSGAVAAAGPGGRKKKRK